MVNIFSSKFTNSLCLICCVFEGKVVTSAQYFNLLGISSVEFIYGGIVLFFFFFFFLGGGGVWVGGGHKIISLLCHFQVQTLDFPSKKQIHFQCLRHPGIRSLFWSTSILRRKRWVITHGYLNLFQTSVRRPMRHSVLSLLWPRAKFLTATRIEMKFVFLLCPTMISAYRTEQNRTRSSPEKGEGGSNPL